MDNTTCTVGDCTRKLFARGMCAAHYQRKRQGRPMDPPILSAREGCSVDGCDRKHHAKGMCAVHYGRASRGADIDAPIRGALGECSVDGCRRLTDARGLCTGHYQRWQKGRPVDGPLYEPPAIVKYSAVHKRIAKQRGPASSFSCTDCHGAAEHWSYRMDCDEELADAEFGAYCLHPEHYAPRCAKCHKQYDAVLRSRRSRP